MKNDPCNKPEQIPDFKKTKQYKPTNNRTTGDPQRKDQHLRISNLEKNVVQFEKTQ